MIISQAHRNSQIVLIENIKGKPEIFRLKMPILPCKWFTLPEAPAQNELIQWLPPNESQTQQVNVELDWERPLSQSHPYYNL